LEPCSHGDFLGAILGTGITRDKVGDILLQGERGAQVLVDPELVDYLTSTLEKVSLYMLYNFLPIYDTELQKL
jgi:RNA-binding protein YlmH